MGKTTKGADGLTVRERAFVNLRRSDSESFGWQLAKKAGYKGKRHALEYTAQRLMRTGRVHRAIFALRSKAEELRSKTIDQLSDAELGLVIKQAWLDIVRSNHAGPGDKARAAAMLGKTIAKFFVPLEVDTRGTVTMEEIVRQMGGAPPEDREHPEEVH